MASRYNSYDSRSSTTSSLSSSTTTPSTHAIVKSKPSHHISSSALGGKGKSNNLTATMKKLMGSKKTASEKAAPWLIIPHELHKAAAATRKGGGAPSAALLTLQKKLFGKENSRKEPKALTESKSNTRTLAMVLRSERELLSANKEQEVEIDRLKSMLQTKNTEVEKLKDLCLRQKEEIRSMKNAVLFPDVTSSDMQSMLDKQGSELNQAKQLIPNLQRQVSSLTGQLQSLAEDLAEVKADKYAKFRCQLRGSSHQISSFNYEETTNSWEFSSSNGTTPCSPEAVLPEDFNPCLTPYCARPKSKEFEAVSYNSSILDSLSEENIKMSGGRIFDSQIRTLFKSSDCC